MNLFVCTVTLSFRFFAFPLPPPSLPPSSFPPPLPQLIMPGYCVAGTIGHKVLSGAKKIEIDKKIVNVKLSVQYMSFRYSHKWGRVSVGVAMCCVIFPVLMLMLKELCS